MCRRVWLSGGVVVGVGLVGVVVALLLTRPTDNITQAGYDALDIGMNEGQVEAVLGVPAGDYTTGEVAFADHGYGMGGGSRGSSHGPVVVPVPTTFREWHGNGGSLDAVFDQDGRLMRAGFRPGAVQSFDPLLVIRRLLHLP